MEDFDLDLRAIEERMEDDDEEDRSIPSDIEGIELGILDGSTEPEEWIGVIEQGRVLVLAIEGDLNELAAGFARDIHELGGELVHFRGFLIISPPSVPVDSSRLD